MKRVITYGTFDLFHIGHLNLIKRLSEIGELTVGVSTDEFNISKGKKNIVPFEDRIKIVESCKYVSNVIPENSWEQKVEDIKNHNIDVFAIGEDWTGKFDHLTKYCKVIYLPRTEGISTTEIKKSLGSLSNIDKEQLIKALEILETLKRSLL